MLRPFPTGSLKYLFFFELLEGLVLLFVNLIINVRFDLILLAIGVGKSSLGISILLEILLNVQHVGDLITLNAGILSLNIIVLPLLLLSNGRGSATLHYLILINK